MSWDEKLLPPAMSLWTPLYCGWVNLMFVLGTYLFGLFICISVWNQPRKSGHVHPIVDIVLWVSYFRWPLSVILCGDRLTMWSFLIASIQLLPASISPSKKIHFTFRHFFIFFQPTQLFQSLLLNHYRPKKWNGLFHDYL